MKYKTTDEWQNFSFSEAYIADIQATNGFFHMELDNVTILPENSCNRDIRKMRTNGLLLKLEDIAITSMVEEGYKVFDANGNPMKQVEDVVIAEKEYFSVMKEFVEGIIFSLEKKIVWVVVFCNLEKCIQRLSGIVIKGNAVFFACFLLCDIQMGM